MSKKETYDEKQQLDRSKAAKYGFCTAIGFSVLAYIGSVAGLNLGPHLTVIFTVCIPTFIALAIIICKGAFDGIQGTGGGLFFSLGAVWGLVNACILASDIKIGFASLSENGILTQSGANLAVYLLVIASCIIYWGKRIQLRRKEKHVETE